ncbi:LemA family protein [bacterium]|nr:LemA family protein [bacterium]
MVIFLIGALVVPLLIVVSIYNGLISKRNMAQNAFSSIDVMLKRRHDLIPNLVEVVKGYAAHEKEVFDSVTKLRNQAVNSSTPIAARFEAEQQLTPQLGRLIAVAESYPELKANEQFMMLQRNLTESEEQIAASRRAYNAAVLQLNNAVDTFPSNIFAKQFGIKRHGFYSFDGPPDQSVNFN